MGWCVSVPSAEVDGVSQCPVRGGWCVPCQTVGGSPGDSVIHSDPHTEQAEKIKLPTRWEFN